LRTSIDLIAVEKRFGDGVALHPTTLSITPGETTVLIGPSGSGKSTILRIVIGLIEPTSGEVRFDGRAVRSENLLALRHRIGYVIQEGGLFPHLTVRENIFLLGRHLKKPSSYLDDRLASLCALTRFPREALDRYPVELSGGQRQRVGLMRALLLDPDVLLMDEPMGALDPLVRADLQQEFREIFAKLSPTVLFVTHDLAEAAYLATRLVLLKDGRIVQIGTVEDLRRAPAEPFVSEFLRAQRVVSR
jgi:osmoprotectant transport system ATP-binding protein